MTVELTLSELNGRFQLINRPTALPGKCSVCGAVNKPVIDFGLTIDFYGVVYICLEDMRAAARIIGMVDKELLDQAELIRRPDAGRVQETTDEFLSRISAAALEYAGRIYAVSTIPTEVQPEILDRKSETVLGSNEVNTPTDDNNAGDERSSSVSGSHGNGKHLFDV